MKFVQWLEGLFPIASWRRRLKPALVSTHNILQDRVSQGMTMMSPDIDSVEKEYGSEIGREWFEQFVQQTQVTEKASDSNFGHGRLIYAILNHMAKKRAGRENKQMQ